MKELKGTKTEKNLQEAFAGESQARNKYTYFASKAKKELHWVAERDLNKMCEDSWRWQSMNPNGYED